MVPQTPQTQLQKRRPVKIAAELIRDARLMSAGVRRNPSSDVIRNAPPQISTVVGMLSNCMKETSPSPAVTTIGPRYGIELKMPASRPQTTYCCRPNHHSMTDV